MKGYRKKYNAQLKRKTKNDKGKEKHNDDDSDVDRVVATNEVFLILSDDNLINLTMQQSNWVIISGTSIHATSRRIFFVSYTSGDFCSVRMSNAQLKLLPLGMCTWRP